MISCKLYGRLGNNLFQYAATIVASLKYNTTYCIPKHTLNDKIWKPYYFEGVNYCDNTEGIYTVRIWKEYSHAYNEIPKPDHRLFILDGYFQSYLYSQDYLPELRKLFGFETDMIIRAASLHIRRGDYLTLAEHHPVVTMDYISQALSIVRNNGTKQIMCFSDDIDWVMENVNENIFPDLEFTYIHPTDEVEDLKTMAKCEHNIIANSSYSWWGAYLNNNPDKIVITPDESNWFGVKNRHLDVKDLLPKKWLKIKY